MTLTPARVVLFAFLFPVLMTLAGCGPSLDGDISMLRYRVKKLEDAEEQRRVEAAKKNPSTCVKYTLTGSEMREKISTDIPCPPSK